MSSDDTEGPRRALVEAINEDPGDRKRLEAKHGQLWDTDELRADFDVQGFAAPFIIVTRKSDGVKGSLLFQHYPRFYWGFAPT